MQCGSCLFVETLRLHEESSEILDCPWFAWGCTLSLQEHLLEPLLLQRFLEDFARCQAFASPLLRRWPLPSRSNELAASAHEDIAAGTAGLHLPASDRSRHCRTSIATARSQWALPDLNRELQISVGNAGPQPRGPDPSGQRRTSTASARSQWAVPDLNREVQIPMGNAGPQPRAPDPSGQRRTSTASSRSQWATPDLNRELPIPVGNAGPQPRAPDPSGQRRTSTVSSGSQWAVPDLNRQIECQKECPAMPTEIWNWQMRSGRAHCDLELADEAPQCPLRSGAGKEAEEKEKEEKAERRF
eukprot:s3442_g2.t1